MVKEERRILWDVDEELKPYRGVPDMKKMVEGQYTGFIRFMAEHGLFTTSSAVVDKSGKLTQRIIYLDELTKEGFEFVKLAENAWLKSKASAKDPSKTTLLDKKLAELRGQ